MRKSDASANKGSPVELELPDWTGMDDSSARVGPEQAFRLWAEYRTWFPQLVEGWQSQRPEKCVAEFVL